MKHKMFFHTHFCIKHTFTLDTENNEFPTFKLMKLKLNKSLIRDKKIFKIITNLYPQRIQKKFIFKHN